MDDYSHMSPKGYVLNKDNATGLRLKGEEPLRQKKGPHPFTDIFKDFFANTSLHGFRYVTDDSSTWLERTWWIVMIVCSILASSFYIKMAWNKWEENPVIVSFADTSNSVWHVPFPAVTICTEIKPSQRKFNFTKAFYDIRNEPSTISPEDLKMYQDMLLLCNYADGSGPDMVNASSIKTLEKVAPTREEVFYECLWDNLSCEQMFSHTLTKDGYCFTFNMFSAEDMFRTENLHKEYVHVAGKNKSHWSVERGYPPGTTIKTYPLRGPSYGDVEFEVILLTDTRDMDLICRGPVQGFKIWLHNPAELPNMGQNFFRLPINYQSAAAVMPRIMDTSNDLRKYYPHKRQCYFADERYLRFFRLYTQRNCELECKSNHTAYRCNCVPLYMPHGPETRVCGAGKRKCVQSALEEFSLSKSYLKPSTTRNLHVCDCLQACTELHYDAEVSQAVYDLRSFKRGRSAEIANETKLPSGLVVYFSADLFTSLSRSELYGHVDFLANCGGIMGLFMGFSFLSLIEIVYYFTVRLCCYIRKSSVVVANNDC